MVDKGWGNVELAIGKRECSDEAWSMREWREMMWAVKSEGGGDRGDED